MKLTLLIFTLAVSMATAFVETDIDDKTEINSFIELLLQSAKQQAGNIQLYLKATFYYTAVSIS